MAAAAVAVDSTAIIIEQADVQVQQAYALVTHTQALLANTGGMAMGVGFGAVHAAHAVGALVANTGGMGMGVGVGAVHAAHAVGALVVNTGGIAMGSGAVHAAHAVSAVGAAGIGVAQAVGAVSIGVAHAVGAVSIGAAHAVGGVVGAANNSLQIAEVKVKIHIAQAAFMFKQQRANVFNRVSTFSRELIVDAQNELDDAQMLPNAEDLHAAHVPPAVIGLINNGLVDAQDGVNAASLQIVPQLARSYGAIQGAIDYISDRFGAAYHASLPQRIEYDVSENGSVHSSGNASQSHHSLVSRSSSHAAPADSNARHALNRQSRAGFILGHYQNKQQMDALSSQFSSDDPTHQSRTRQRNGSLKHIATAQTHNRILFKLSKRYYYLYC